MGSKSLFRRKAADAPESAMVLKVLFRKGEDGYVIAECPQLPGCMSQGKTEEDARCNIVDAIRSVLAIRLGEVIAEGSSESPLGSGSHEEFFRLKDIELIAV